MCEAELLKLIIQPAITVIGWGVAALWAIRQLNLANQKTLELQRTLMRESHKRSLANELIDIYKDIAQSINKLHQSGIMFQVNIIVEEELDNGHNSYSAKNLVAPINAAYNELCRDLFRLSIWMKVSGEHIPKIERLREAEKYFEKHFGIDEAIKNNTTTLWISIQAILNTYLTGGHIRTSDKFGDTWSEFSKHLECLQDMMGEGTAEVNRALIDS